MRRLALLAAAVVVAMPLVACGDDDSQPSGAAPNTPDTKVCPGEPVKLMSISSITGAVPAPTVEASIGAAERAVNDECSAGRPVEITVCDDSSDKNRAQDCARKAVDGGYVALVGSLSTAPDGAFGVTDAAGIPNFGNLGVGITELTSPNSFPLGNSVVLALGFGATTASAGAKTMTLVAPDIPQNALFTDLMTKESAKLGLDVKRTVLFPPDASDFAQYAAQAQGTDGIGFLGSQDQVKVMLQSLLDAGVDFSETVVTVPPYLSPEMVEEFGQRLDGVYMISTAFPVASSNPGVDQYLREMKAVGKGDLATAAGQVTWRAAHLMAEEVIPKLSTVDRPSILAYLTTAKFAPPDIPPSDFTRNAFSDHNLLKTLRLFSDQFVLDRVVDGELVAALDHFVSCREVFEIPKS